MKIELSITKNRIFQALKNRFISSKAWAQNLILKRLEVYLKIFHVFICLLKFNNLNNEYALDIVKG